MKVSDINKTTLFESGIRLDASFHLSEAQTCLSKLKKSSFSKNSLSQLSDNIFKGNIFKRTYVDNPVNGFSFISASDMMKAEIKSDKYLSKKYSNINNLKVDKNWILVSRSGTLGNTAYTNEDYKELVLSDDLIRIATNEEKMLSGYLYAYLSSKYGYNLLTQSSYGGVIQHIEPHHLFELPVPLIEESKQQEIHNLIVESSNLRVQANQFLKECIELFDFMDIKYKSGEYITSNICINKINGHKKRFDANYNVVSANVENIINKQKIEFVTVKDLTSGIFIGPRSKRNYVQNGIPFLSTSEMQKANPTKTEKFISEKASNGFIVKEGWLLTTRSGTLGDTVYSLPCVEGFAVSEHAIRIVLKDNSVISNKYLFAFLKSNIGVNSLVSGSYGSVILHLNEEYIGDIKVPILAKEKIILIETKIEIYLSNLNQAILKENQAIDLIEKEIDAWQ